MKNAMIRTFFLSKLSNKQENKTYFKRLLFQAITLYRILTIDNGYHQRNDWNSTCNDYC